MVYILLAQISLLLKLGEKIITKHCLNVVWQTVRTLRVTLDPTWSDWLPFKICLVNKDKVFLIVLDCIKANILIEFHRTLYQCLMLNLVRPNYILVFP